jgi:hypothetical protein
MSAVIVSVVDKVVLPNKTTEKINFSYHKFYLNLYFMTAWTWLPFF